MYKSKQFTKAKNGNKSKKRFWFAWLMKIQSKSAKILLMYPKPEYTIVKYVAFQEIHSVSIKMSGDLWQRVTKYSWAMTRVCYYNHMLPEYCCQIPFPFLKRSKTNGALYGTQSYIHRIVTPGISFTNYYLFSCYILNRL